MKRYSLRWKGSFTIEAAVVVPMVMVMLAACLYMAFHIHNAATMAAVTDAAVMELAAGWEEAPDSAGRDLEGILAGRLLGETETSVRVNVTGDAGSAEASAQFRTLPSMIRELTGEKLSSLSFRTEISHLNGRKKLLLYKSICDGVSDLLHP